MLARVSKKGERFPGESGRGRREDDPAEATVRGKRCQVGSSTCQIKERKNASCDDQASGRRAWQNRKEGRRQDAQELAGGPGSCTEHSLQTVWFGGTGGEVTLGGASWDLPS